MKKIGDTMKNNTLKMTTLCMLTIGISQFASAEATRATLPLLKAEQLPAWCDSNLKKIQQKKFLVLKKRLLKTMLPLLRY
jgi:thimet oligopeptidase